MCASIDGRQFRNVESITDYDFCLRPDSGPAGVAAMLRVKNEASKIGYCLRSILELFDEIVVIDNSSEDDTREIVRAFKREHDDLGKVRLYDYPFSVARCGPEHDATPEDSVHSLAYYYNWALSQCTRRYVCKWDADMLARREARAQFRQFLGQLEHGGRRAVAVRGQTVYKNVHGECFLSPEETNAEPRLFPRDCENYYVKVEHFERIRLAPSLSTEEYPGVVFYELKFADEDEFAHWSTRQFPTSRKRKEWQSFESFRTSAAEAGRFVPLSPTFLEDQCDRQRS